MPHRTEVPARAQSHGSHMAANTEEEGEEEEEELFGIVHARVYQESFFDCSWSLLNLGAAQRMRLNLGNLNPIYERELTRRR